VKTFFLAATLLVLPTLAGAASFTFIVAGLGGEPEYEDRFREETAVIGAAAVEAAGGDKSHVFMLTGEQARRDSLRRAFQEFAAKVKPTDSATVVLIGHGTYDGEEYRFNIPGTDITGSELGQLFDRLTAKKQLIVNATSSSGATIELWQRPERVVITATKSGGERTATRFAQYWGQAVSGDAADVNKDETVTAAEAFDYANRQVAASYKADVSLATEHARIAGDETAAFTVARIGSSASSAANPEVTALLTQRGQIEQDLEGVKGRKASLSEDQYYDELEGVLVRLAMLQKQIDAKRAVQ
jgi:hypothetical protein